MGFKCPSPLQAACCIAGTDIALAAGDRLVALPWSLHGYGGMDSKLTIGEAGLGPKAKPDCTSTVSSPPGSTLRCGAAVSPSSDRIAWLIAKDKKEGGTIVSVWVSQLDGSEWHEVGQQEAPAPDKAFGQHLLKFRAGSPGELQWLPDGKTLSFFYQGDLYTIPMTRQVKPRGKLGVATNDDPALNRLIHSLGEGPIRVRPAGHGAGAVSQEEAVKAAKRAVGVDGPPDKAWRVAVNDREFMSGLLDDKPCWLLYYPNAVQLPLSFEGKDARALGLYVAVDAATGRVWEAFTEPETPWWKRVRAKNEDICAPLRGPGRRGGRQPGRAPACRC